MRDKSSQRNLHRHLGKQPRNLLLQNCTLDHSGRLLWFIIADARRPGSRILSSASIMSPASRRLRHVRSSSSEGFIQDTNGGHCPKLTAHLGGKAQRSPRPPACKTPPQFVAPATAGAHLEQLRQVSLSTRWFPFFFSFLRTRVVVEFSN